MIPQIFIKIWDGQADFLFFGWFGMEWPRIRFHLWQIKTVEINKLVTGRANGYLFIYNGQLMGNDLWNDKQMTFVQVIIGVH